MLNSPLYNIFHSYKDIIEVMTKHKCSWDGMHHHYFFLLEKSFVPIDAPSHDICIIESKDFLPPRQVD